MGLETGELVWDLQWLGPGDSLRVVTNRPQAFLSQWRLPKTLNVV